MPVQGPELSASEALFATMRYINWHYTHRARVWSVEWCYFQWPWV